MNWIVVVAALALALAPIDAQAQTRDVTGIVRRSDTGAPVPGVLVETLGTLRRVCTDERGRFTLVAVEGDLQVSTLRTGFGRAWFTIGAVADSAELRIEPATVPADGRLVFIGGKQLVETAPSSQALAPSAPIIFLGGVRLAPDREARLLKLSWPTDSGFHPGGGVLPRARGYIVARRGRSSIGRATDF